MAPGKPAPAGDSMRNPSATRRAPQPNKDGNRADRRAAEKEERKKGK